MNKYLKIMLIMLMCHISCVEDGRINRNNKSVINNLNKIYSWQCWAYQNKLNDKDNDKIPEYCDFDDIQKYNMHLESPPIYLFYERKSPYISATAGYYLFMGFGNYFKDDSFQNDINAREIGWYCVAWPKENNISGDTLYFIDQKGSIHHFKTQITINNINEKEIHSCFKTMTNEGRFNFQ